MRPSPRQASRPPKRPPRWRPRRCSLPSRFGQDLADRGHRPRSCTAGSEVASADATRRRGTPRTGAAHRGKPQQDARTHRAKFSAAAAPSARPTAARRIQAATAAARRRRRAAEHSSPSSAPPARRTARAYGQAHREGRADGTIGSATAPNCRYRLVARAAEAHRTPTPSVVDTSTGAWPSTRESARCIAWFVAWSIAWSRALSVTGTRCDRD